MVQSDRVICVATNSKRVYIALTDSSNKLYLLESPEYPATFTDGEWLSVAAEPIDNVPELGRHSTSCAVGDDASFMLLSTFKTGSSEGTPLSFWGAYLDAYTRRWKYFSPPSTTACVSVTQCSHQILTTKQGEQQLYVHALFLHEKRTVEFSPLGNGGFTNYSMPIVLDQNSSPGELVHFAYSQGQLNGLRIHQGSSNFTVLLQSFEIDSLGLPHPAPLPTSKTSATIPDSCFTNPSTIKDMVAATPSRYFYWCESNTNVNNLYEYDGSSARQFTAFQRTTVFADGYHPVPASIPSEPPAWALVTMFSNNKEGHRVYAVSQRDASAGKWLNNKDPIPFTAEGVRIPSLISVPTILSIVASILTIGICALLLYQRHRWNNPKLPTFDEALAEDERTSRRATSAVARNHELGVYRPRRDSIPDDMELPPYSPRERASQDTPPGEALEMRPM